MTITETSGVINSLPEGRLINYDFSDKTFQNIKIGINNSLNFTNRNLSGANFANSNLLNIDFTGGSFENASFENATLNNAIFSNLTLKGSNFQNADLSSAKLTSVDLTNATFNANTNLTNVRGFSIVPMNRDLKNGYKVINGIIIGKDVDLTNINLQGVDLTDVDLSKTTLTGLTGQIADNKYTQTRENNLITCTSSVTLPNKYHVISRFIVGPNVILSGVDFDRFDLHSQDLTGANLTGAYIPSAKLEDAILENANLREANFQNTNLKNAHLEKANLSGANFEGANLTGANLTGANLTGANLRSANLTGAKLMGAILDGVSSRNITGVPSSLPNNYEIINNFLVGPKVNLTNANFYDNQLNGKNLTGAILTGITSGKITRPPTLDSRSEFKTIYSSDKEYSYIIGPGCNLENANLENVDFTEYKNLTNVNFNNANLRGANLRGANLRGARFNLTNLTNTNLTNSILIGVSSNGISGRPILPNNYKLLNGFILGPGVDLTNANLVNLDLTGVNLTGANFNNLRSVGIRGTPTMPGYFIINGHIVGPNVNLNNANLENQDLSGISLVNVKSGEIIRSPSTKMPNNYSLINGFIIGPNVDLKNADLTNANLTNANFNGANLDSVILTEANLTNVLGTNMINQPRLSQQYSIVNNESGLSHIFGPNVNLTNVTFFGTDTIEFGIKNLSGTNLSNAIFRKINLSGVDLTNSNLTNVISASIVGTPSKLPNANYIFTDETDPNQNDTRISGKRIIGPRMNLCGLNLNNTRLNANNLTGVSSGRILGNPILPNNYKLLNGYIVGPTVNLTNANLKDQDLTGIDLTGANLTNADLTNANLKNATLTRAVITKNTILNGLQSGRITGTPPLPPGYNFKNGYIVGPGVDLTKADLTYVDLNNVKLTNIRGGGITGEPTLPEGYMLINGYIIGPDVNLTNANLINTNLTNANLSNAILIGLKSRGILGNPILPNNYKLLNGYIIGPSVDLASADLKNLNLSESNVSLSDTNLTSANLTSVNLSGVDLTDSNLTSANLTRANLTNANLTDSNLTSANLTNANLTNTTITNAIFKDVIIDNTNSNNLIGEPDTLPNNYIINELSGNRNFTTIDNYKIIINGQIKDFLTRISNPMQLSEIFDNDKLADDVSSTTSTGDITRTISKNNFSTKLNLKTNTIYLFKILQLTSDNITINISLNGKVKKTTYKKYLSIIINDNTNEEGIYNFEVINNNSTNINQIIYRIDSRAELPETCGNKYVDTVLYASARYHTRTTRMCKQYMTPKISTEETDIIIHKNHNNDAIYSLEHGSSLKNISYGFLTTAYARSSMSNPNPIQFSIGQQNTAIAIFDYISKFTNLEFINLGMINNADQAEPVNILFVTANIGTSATIPLEPSSPKCFCYLTNGGRSANDIANINPDIGGYDWCFLLHEIGHTLGLKHPGNDVDGGAFLLVDPKERFITNNDKRITCMSYNGPLQANTYSILDIVALQYLYGKNNENDVYKIDTRLNGRLVNNFVFENSTPVVNNFSNPFTIIEFEDTRLRCRTLISNNGTDAIDVSKMLINENVSSDQMVIDLNGGHFSTLPNARAKNNLAIAYDSFVNKVILPPSPNNRSFSYNIILNDKGNDILHFSDIDVICLNATILGLTNLNIERVTITNINVNVPQPMQIKFNNTILATIRLPINRNLINVSKNIKIIPDSEMVYLSYKFPTELPP